MDCILYSVGSSYVGEVHETIQRLGWSVRAYIANQADGGRIPDYLSPIMRKDQIAPEWLQLPVIFPLITPGYRQQLHEEVTELGFTCFASVIDPTAIVASRSSIQPGALVNSGVMIGANCNIGRFVVLNRGVSLGHDVVFEDFVTLGPGAIVCGGSHIMKGSFVGAGAIINPGVTVGANCIVGSGTVVRSDVPDNVLLLGNPGKIAKESIKGYNGVGVR